MTVDIEFIINHTQSPYKGVFQNMKFLINHQYKEKKGDRSNKIFIKDSEHTMANKVAKRWDF